ncbi:unnamed protein product [Peronospora farinosa]|uniref:Spt6 acidic N-terminal domain-containing protein n=1 Tax=Peronospora farinosa TaxID=134698 RepID=A0ABN8C9Y1_9STRA|nr:unnamed protein product [Peronospora farinosa]
MHRTDADDIASDDAGLRKSKKGKKRAKKDKIAAYRDAATNADLADVYAVENRFAADAEEEKVDEDADDGYDDEELDGANVKIRGRICKDFGHWD